MSAPWTTAQIPDLSGRVIVITGANSGIGFEAARVLVARGAQVVMACRNPAKAAGAEAALRAETPAARVAVMALDVSSLRSVRSFAEELLAAHPRIDALCNNAGVMALPPGRTDEGFDVQLATNHLGHFALTALLLDALRAAEAPRVVNVSSGLHRIGGDRFEALFAGEPMNPWRVYGQTKLANVLFSAELDRRARAKGLALRALSCHPGYAATNLQESSAALGAAGFSESMARLGNKYFAQSAAAGAWPTLFALTSPDAQGGDYVGPGGLTESAGPPVRARASRAGRDPELATRLWALSVKATGADFAGL
jgi:NAD(P)-dependent dehydrogenase (short-subunit alcohol dehydrogenase family)